MNSKATETLLHHKFTDWADFESEIASFDVLNTSSVITVDFGFAMRFNGHFTIRPPITSNPFDESCSASLSFEVLLILSSSSLRNFLETDSWTRISLMMYKSSDDNDDEMKSDAESRSEDSVTITEERRAVSKG